MGKSWKGRSHLNTGYPYNPIRAAHLQVIRPKVHHEDQENLFLGMYVEAGHPIFGKAELSRQHGDLKRLAFLRAYGHYYYTKVAHAYSTSRACLPASFKPGLRAVEDRVSYVSGPLMNGLQNSSERVLWTLDEKVDYLFRAAQKAMGQKAMSDAREEHARAVEECSQARQVYLLKVEETLQFLRENGISGTARLAVNTMLGRIDEAQKYPAHLEGEAGMVVGKVNEAWSKLVALPPVSKLLETAQPSVEYTQRKYANAHDAIVASTVYNRALEAAAEVLQRVQESQVYRAAAERFYPAISQFADPALAKIAHSPYTRAVVDHLKPQGAKESAAEGDWPVVSCIPC